MSRAHGKASSPLKPQTHQNTAWRGSSVVVGGFLSYIALLLLFTVGYRALNVSPGGGGGEQFVHLLLHAGMALALMLILWEIYKLTGRTYVRSWAGAFSFFLLLYAYLLVLGATWSSQPPAWTAWGTELLSFGSTFFLGLAALQLLRLEPERRQLQWSLLASLALVVGLHLAYANIPGLSALKLLPGGVLALFVTAACGWGVFRRMPAPSPRSWGFLVTFLLYGLAQPLIPFLHDGGLQVALSTVTFILKALCAGAVIFIVLNEVWREKQRQIEAANRAKRVLDRTLDDTGHGHFQTDATGNILALNEAEARILGYGSAADVLARKVNRLDVVADPEVDQPLKDRLLERVQSQENRILKPDGKVAYLLSHWRPSRTGTSDEHSGVEGIDRDITEEVVLRQQREAELTLREEFNDAFNHSSDLGAYFDHVLRSVVAQTEAPAGAILLVGRDTIAARPLLMTQSIEPDSVRNKVFVADDDESLGAYFGEPGPLNNDPLKLATELFACESGEIWTVPILTFDDRRLGLVLLHAGPEGLKKGGIGVEALQHFLGRASTAYPLVLRRETDSLRQDLLGYLYAQAETRVRLTNLANWLKDCLRCDAVMISMSLWEGGTSQEFRSNHAPASSLGLLPQAEDIHETEAQAVAGSFPSFEEEALQIFAEASVPIVDHEKKVLGRLTVHNPRSAAGDPRALSELDLEKLSEIAETIGSVAETWISLRNRIRLFDTASHEFRSPAVAIRNTTDLLLTYYKNYDEPQIRRKLEDISTDASILIRQAQKIDVSADRDLARGPSEVLVFGNVIFKTIRQLRALSPSSVRFEHQGKHLIPTLWLVEEELAQIVFNLVYNAIKYAEHNRQPYIKVVAEEKLGYYLLRFQDHGIGVPEGWEEKIFEAERRAPNGTRHDVRGMGLGLTISRDLAQRMGGDLRLTRHKNPTELTLYLSKSSAAIPQEKPT